MRGASPCLVTPARPLPLHSALLGMANAAGIAVLVRVYACSAQPPEVYHRSAPHTGSAFSYVLRTESLV